MTRRTSRPGISRSERLSEEGLDRLRRQLAAGAVPSEQVLAQWVRRYGDAARKLILRYAKTRTQPE